MVIWLITDTHLWHDNIATYCNRPWDFTSVIIQKWHSLVQPQDLVYHLGDVAFNRTNLGKLLPTLPGHKVLVRGNHDRPSSRWFTDHGFEQVHDRGSLLLPGGVLLSHKPVSADNPDVKVQIHGHFHNNHPDCWGVEACNNLTLKHRLLAIEWTGYAPVPLDACLAGCHVVPTMDILCGLSKADLVTSVPRLKVRDKKYKVTFHRIASPGSE